MTIEVTRTTKWIWRISPKDPLVIEQRLNQAGSRWLFFMSYASAYDARMALLKLGKEGEEDK